MGGAVSSGRNNDELVDNLMKGNYIRSQGVEQVFRVLDRADYMSPEARDQAYKDLAWRNGPLHLSAPCIYSEVMEALELKPGLSFLNVGSGTGYLSTLVGLVLGSSGISHGVEALPYVHDYSTTKLSQFIENSIILDEFDFCTPKYYLGNGLCLAPTHMYDRVYCGAGVLDKYEHYFKLLTKVGGVLVMPLEDTLVQLRRVTQTHWTRRNLLHVSFALLKDPTKEEQEDLVKLDEASPPPLQVLARGTIRAAMRAGLMRRHPELRPPPPPPPPPAPASRASPRRICIPYRVSDDDDDDDLGDLNELHDLDDEGGAHEMNALLSLVLSMSQNRQAGSLQLLAHTEHLEDDLEDDEDSSLSSSPSPQPGPEAAEGEAGETEAAPTSGSTKVASTTDSTKGASTSDARKGASPSDSRKGASTSNSTKAASVSGSTKRASFSGPTRGASVLAFTKRASGSGSTKAPSTSDSTRNESSIKKTKKKIKFSTRLSGRILTRRPAPAAAPEAPKPRSHSPSAWLDSSSSDDDGTQMKERKRQKLDSGLGEGTASSASPDKSDDKTTPSRSSKFGEDDSNDPDTDMPWCDDDEAEADSASSNSSSDSGEDSGSDSDSDSDSDGDEAEQTNEATVASRVAAIRAELKRKKLHSGHCEAACGTDGASVKDVRRRLQRRAERGVVRGLGRAAVAQVSAAASASAADSASGAASASCAASAPGAASASCAASAPGAGPECCPMRHAHRTPSAPRNLRRVNLSLAMKRGCKELPLPHALKKYINYGRCYQF